MGILQFFLGAVILAAIIADIFTTTLTARGGRFVTNARRTSICGR